MSQWRSAVVTGAASGIGAALAQELAEQGTRLVLADRDHDPLQRLADELDAVPVAVDVGKPADNDKLAVAAGPVDLVCLNAGITGTHAGPVWATPLEEWDDVLNVNLGGVINGLRAFVPSLLATGRRHQILITASLAGLATWPGGGSYAASKHAVVTVAEQAALTLADTPVSVTVLCPALVRTGLSEMGEDPHVVAAAALAAAERADFVVVDETWKSAVRERAETLISGRRPRVPEPSLDT